MKATFSNLGKYGRLGNQLWQYAFLKAYQLRNPSVDVCIPNLKEMSWHGQECLLENFELSLPQKFCEGLPLWLEQDPQEFNEQTFAINKSVDFLGFFQNTLYFKGFEEEIKKEFSFKPWLEQTVNDRIEKIRRFLGPNKKLVSLHIRRGDLVEQTKNDNFFGNEESTFFRYWNAAKKHFDEDKVCFLIFTGGSRENEYENDLKWVSENIQASNMIISDTRSSILDFALISKCDHNIMSHASSFSWWAAYLNKNPEKKVIAPKFYFIDRPQRFVDGFYPKEFTLI